MHLNKLHKKARMIDYIQHQCVTIIDDHIYEGNQIQAMLDWCNEKVGQMRICHPIYDAYEGHMEYLGPDEDGVWAVESTVDGVLFWFEKEVDRTLFKLTWL